MGGEPVRAVLFDLDGTLLDTLADIAWAMNSVLARNGYPVHPLDAYRSMVGSGLGALVRRALPPGADTDSPQMPAVLEQELRVAYASDPVGRTRPYEQIDELVRQLRRMNMPLAVLSNKAEHLVQPIVSRFFAPDDFVVVRGMQNGVPAKPDPAGALLIAAELDVLPRACLYLGDSDVDMITARNAGMVPVGAGWGFRGQQELLDSGAACVLEQPLELLGVIAGSAEERR